ncbi:BnaCnng66950D [Brassica napus]|uniref:BnaCnng66950D protein n=1 Tax=Brassica napus TaxID=3708 RepID=A0A078JUL4_BRANA|nr:BnaCnng66950D [Brassica napus]
MYLELKSEADKCFYLPNSSELIGLNVFVVQGHGCERKSRVSFVVFPFTGVKEEVTGVKFHFYY